MTARLFVISTVVQLRKTFAAMSGETPFWPDVAVETVSADGVSVVAENDRIARHPFSCTAVAMCSESTATHRPPVV